MKKQFFAIAFIAASFSFVACNNEAKTEETPAVDTAAVVEAPVEEAGVMVGGANMVPSKNIVENAAGSADHTTLVAAVKAASLDSILSTEGPFTVFAPTNAAFEKLPAGTVEGLLAPEKKADLAGILTYHVVAGALKASDLTDGQKLKTVNGGELTVGVKEGVYTINGAVVTIADVVSKNGVTHVIDAVLLPAAPKSKKK